MLISAKKELSIVNLANVLYIKRRSAGRLFYIDFIGSSRTHSWEFKSEEERETVYQNIMIKFVQNVEDISKNSEIISC